MIQNNQDLHSDAMIYIEYRNTSKELNHKILKYMEQSEKQNYDLQLLNLIKGNNIYMHDEGEKDKIYDLIIYEKTFNGKNGLDIYLENNEATDTKELQLINAMQNAKTVLYEVIDSNDEKSTVKLKDINTEEIIEIIDFGFSKTLNTNALIFTRILQTKEVNFTSGLAMIFNKNHKDFLDRVLKKDIRKSNLDNEIQKFISYFYLSRKHGANVTHKDITK